MRFLVLLLASCATVVPAVVEAPKVEAPVTVVTTDIEKIVAANSCKDVYFNNRGKAPIGYVLGMAKSYAQAKCNKDLTARLTKAPHSKEDAYSRYGLKPTLTNVFTLMYGLGMRESSGRWCCGRDMSASWTQSDTAEAGIWQTSWNSRNFSPKYLPGFFTSWNKSCFLSDFQKGATCKSGDLKNWGDKADGLYFQKKSKECPPAQLEFTALLLKETYRHHGPLVRKEVQFVNSCKELFEQIDAVTVCK